MTKKTYHMLIIALLLICVAIASCGQSRPGEVNANPLPEATERDHPQGPEMNPQAPKEAPSLSEHPAEDQDISAGARPYQIVGEELNLTTEDGIRIAATLYQSNADAGVILLPMMAHDRSSYDTIVSNLANRYSVIAIDLRGHGKSQGRQDRFTDTDFMNMVYDVAAARKALGKDKAAIIGASIGANLGLLYAANDHTIKTVIALSPGLEYRGVKISDAVKYFDRPALLVASKSDPYAYSSSRKLAASNGNMTLETYTGDKHGTDLFGSGAGIEGYILQWLSGTMG